MSIATWYRFLAISSFVYIVYQRVGNMLPTFCGVLGFSFFVVIESEAIVLYAGAFVVDSRPACICW